MPKPKLKLINTPPPASMSLEEMSQNLLTVQETAKLLHLKEKTIYNLLASGKLKKIALRGKVFCWKPQIEKLVKTALEEVLHGFVD